LCPGIRLRSPCRPRSSLFPFGEIYIPLVNDRLGQGVEHRAVSRPRAIWLSSSRGSATLRSVCSRPRVSQPGYADTIPWRNLSDGRNGQYLVPCSARESKGAGIGPCLTSYCTVARNTLLGSCRADWTRNANFRADFRLFGVTVEESRFLGKECTQIRIVGLPPMSGPLSIFPPALISSSVASRTLRISSSNTTFLPQSGLLPSIVSVFSSIRVTRKLLV